jgi:hypothetical protein
MVKWQRHFAATPMITAVGAEPNPGTYGPDAYRKSGHTFDPPDGYSTSIFTPHRRELLERQRVPTRGWLGAPIVFNLIL